MNFLYIILIYGLIAQIDCKFLNMQEFVTDINVHLNTFIEIYDGQNTLFNKVFLLESLTLFKDLCKSNKLIFYDYQKIWISLLSVKAEQKAKQKEMNEIKGFLGAKRLTRTDKLDQEICDMELGESMMKFFADFEDDSNKNLDDSKSIGDMLETYDQKFRQQFAKYLLVDRQKQSIIDNTMDQKQPKQPKKSITKYTIDTLVGQYVVGQ